MTRTPAGRSRVGAVLAAWWRRWAWPVGGTLAAGWLLYGLISAVVLVRLDRGWVVAAGTAAVYLSAVACGVLALRHEGPAGNALLLAASMAGGLAVHALAPFVGLAIVYLALWVAPFRARLWQAAVVTILAMGAFVWVSQRIALDTDAMLGIAWSLPWVLVLASLLHHLMETRRRSAELAEVRSREAVLGERQRLAREMHDILAHSLSAQIVHLEGARLLLERGGDTAQALDRVVRAGELARAGLGEARQAVESLRDTQPPLRDQLGRLADEYRSAAGSACELKISADLDSFDPAATLAVVRTVQEALTNVRKHAPGADVSMSIRSSAGWHELVITDTGGSAGGVAAAGGYGLAGMRERAKLIGATLEAGANGQGFQVRLRVPA